MRELNITANLLAHYLDGLMITGTNTYKVVADNLGTPRLLADQMSFHTAKCWHYMPRWGLHVSLWRAIVDLGHGFLRRRRTLAVE
jgi:hypothetical protein